MYPKIRVDPGRGEPLIELQKAIDTDLNTNDKTVVGAINELKTKQETLESVTKPLIESINNIKDDRIVSLNVNKLFQESDDVLVFDCGSSIK